MTRCNFCNHTNPAGATRCMDCGAELPGSLEAGHKSLADTLTTLIQSGQKIEAIKQYRERTGSGLKEAKDAVEALERGEQLPTPKGILTTVDQDVVSLVRDGRRLRRSSSFGIKPASDSLRRRQRSRLWRPNMGFKPVGVAVPVRLYRSSCSPGSWHMSSLGCECCSEVIDRQITHGPNCVVTLRR